MAQKVMVPIQGIIHITITDCPLAKNMSKEFYATRLAYAFLLALIVAEVLTFTAFIIRDTRDYALAQKIEADNGSCIYKAPSETTII